ncbi:hypothetical protein SCBWM1_gp12 [Synechococcus phage S-CBWM1]|uniref:Uncharacterized protein n=1 Tax=Synechococcus phage S-CBWM1 TaxID=2053653 RepID=A0A3G1L3D3_9CAUD|nr:hypothetical protein HOU61_gp013 [Synechococcus phage S-CBWM1]ATW62696.1 hypothetical protein SCBWM1_gp12 [Synechococcus phage S-CBWM1]
MKGSSGAVLQYKGGWIRKSCPDASQQLDWFRRVQEFPAVYLIRGVGVPAVRGISEDTYEIERVRGSLGTSSQSAEILDRLLSLSLSWRWVEATSSSSLDSYLERIEREHVRILGPGESPTVIQAMRVLERDCNPKLFPRSFCHGDLTLENILIDKEGKIFLIDPNAKEGLFQSYILDLGKILQSINSNYHREFNSCPGPDQTWMCRAFLENLWLLDLMRGALLAEISHLVRLRKYRPIEQRGKVDSLISRRTSEYLMIYRN